jgi:hypothetical protein
MAWLDDIPLSNLAFWVWLLRERRRNQARRPVARWVTLHPERTRYWSR